MNRIAIIDDSDINLTLLKALVNKLGECEPLLFQESPKGLAWCSENLPELIIVDYMMPELDGIQLISRLRKVVGREEVPILMITANDDKDVRYTKHGERYEQNRHHRRQRYQSDPVKGFGQQTG